MAHICEIPELTQNTGHYGALFAKLIAAQKAFIEKLVTSEAFINKLATNEAFIDRLITKRLLVDSDTASPNNFELAINEGVGIQAKNNGEKVFEVTPTGNIFAKNAILSDCVFSGDIYSGPLELSSKEPLSTIIEIRTADTMKAIYLRYGAFSFNCKTAQGGLNVRKATLTLSYNSIPVYGEKDVWIKFPNPPPGSIDGYWTTINAIGGYASTQDYILTLYTQETQLKQYYYRIVTGITKTDSSVRNLTVSVGDIPIDNRLESNITLQSMGGAKTLKLKDLPTMPPQEAGIIWIDDNKILHIS